MTLRFALLASLSSKPRTGYDIVRIFDRSVGHVWFAPHPQIYPELRRMESERLVEAHELPRGEKGVKREYRLTEAGLSELRRQSSTPVYPARERDPYRLKAAYMEFADPDGAREQFELLISHYQRLRADWQRIVVSLRDRTEPILVERLERKPQAEHDSIVATKMFAYEGMIARAEMEIEWAKKGLALVDELERVQAPTA